MILVTKPTAVPITLRRTGQAADNRNRQDYDADPQAYIRNTREFTIKPSIYNYSTIKKTLKTAQHSKCCFCEKEQKDEYGAVEHYRPKAGFQLLDKSEDLRKPGYYWLGYAWRNLYFVCGPCNTIKGNLFPLVDEATRARSHHDDEAQEDPYLLDPVGPKDPRDHIVFDSAFVRGVSDYGRRTISICGLDRDGLNEKRKKLISDIDFYVVVLATKADNSAAVVQRALAFLTECRNPRAEFSAAAADYLALFPRAILDQIGS